MEITDAIIGHPFPGMPFDILTGQFIQFPVQILGQFFQLGKTVVEMVGIIIHDQNNPSVSGGQTAWPQAA
jgi:hypothetical protein